jgi:hypothetical protein
MGANSPIMLNASRAHSRDSSSVVRASIFASATMLAVIAPSRSRLWDLDMTNLSDVLEALEDDFQELVEPRRV